MYCMSQKDMQYYLKEFFEEDTMKIRDILKSTEPHISFEVFPPKTDAGYNSVYEATKKIAELKPSFISVTYGAGGGTSKNTVNIASNIKHDFGVTSLAHLTCVSSTKDAMGVVRLFA